MPSENTLYTYIVQSPILIDEWTSPSDITFNAQVSVSSSLADVEFGAQVIGENPDFNMNGIKITITEGN